MRGPRAYDLLVVGGTGFLGRHVCDYAINAGLRVAAISRAGPPFLNPMTASQDEHWRSNTEWIIHDATSAVAWSRLDVSARRVLWVATTPYSGADASRLGEAIPLAMDAASRAGATKFAYVACDAPLTLPHVRTQHEIARSFLPEAGSRMPVLTLMLPYVHGVGRLWTIPTALFLQARGFPVIGADVAAAALVRATLDPAKRGVIDPVDMADLVDHEWVVDWRKSARAAERREQSGL